MPTNTPCNNNLPFNKRCGNKKMYGGGNKKQGLVSSIGRPVMMFSMISKQTSTPKKSITNTTTTISVSFKIDNIELSELNETEKNTIINNIQQEYATNLNIPLNNVSVTLISGSIISNVKITSDDTKENNENLLT